MRSEDERKALIDDLEAKLADAAKLKAEANSGEEVDKRKAQKAEALEADLQAQMQVYTGFDSLPDDQKDAAQATAMAYAVLSDATVNASREDAYTAALACLLSGKMSDLEDVPTPPAPLTNATCEMLRKGNKMIVLPHSSSFQL
jgi:hypothetical protein